jgi:major membrane immunogen (membrane-anchored lipoprotein)
MRKVMVMTLVRQRRRIVLRIVTAIVVSILVVTCGSSQMEEGKSDDGIWITHRERSGSDTRLTQVRVNRSQEKRMMTCSWMHLTSDSILQVLSNGQSVDLPEL